jgi:UDP-2,4-diacetamido-2,4,6-trideoxy-beta-L-altropyranose hydrolase
LKIKVLFRVDSGTSVGLGHLKRCLTLAEYFKEAGCLISFASLKLSGHQTSSYERKYTTHILHGNEVSEVIDLIQKKKYNLIVLDSYTLDYQYENALRLNTDIKILAIDDLRKMHSSDFILNHNPCAKTEWYNLSSNQKLFAGYEYTLLRSEFRNLSSRTINKDLKHIFISIGGSDPRNVSLEIAKLLKAYSLTIATTSSNKHVNMLLKYEIEHPKLKVELDHTNLAKLQQQSDLAIVTPSVAASETIAVGTPLIVIQTETNQKNMFEFLADLGIPALKLEELQQITSTVEQLQDRRERQQQLNTLHPIKISLSSKIKEMVAVILSSLI